MVYFFKAIDSCSLNELNSLQKIGYTHLNSKENASALVGSIVELYCEDETTRIEYDKYDNDPWDYKLSFFCKPSKIFNLPHYDWNKPLHVTYPRCLGWCPGVKPQPPNRTGLYLSVGDTNSRYFYSTIYQII